MNTQTSTNMSSAELAKARRVVATYPRYADAQRAVDYLSDQKFPVQHVAIVAEGLRLVEQVTGRLTYGRAALNGAFSGAIMGAFFGFLFGILSYISPLVSALALALYGIVYGAVIGALINVLMHAFTGGKRDFASVGGMAADRYDVMVEEAVADEATRLLQQMSDLPQYRTAPTGPRPQPA